MSAPERSLEDAILAALRAARAVAPTATLTLRIDGVVIEVPPPDAGPPPRAPHELTAAQQRIVGAVGKGGRTGQEVAEALGRSHDAVRRDLAEMVRLGILTNDRSGYSVDPAYLV